MVLRTFPPAHSNPLEVLLLLFGICGAIVDWRYRRKGGKKSTRRDKVFFGVAAAVLAAIFGTGIYVRAIVFGESSYSIKFAIGYAIGPVAILLFAWWELGRWRVRRKNPLPNGAPATIAR